MVNPDEGPAAVPPPTDGPPPVSASPIEPARAPSGGSGRRPAAASTGDSAPERGESAVATAPFSPFVERPVDLALGRAAPPVPPGGNAAEPPPRSHAPSATESMRAALEEHDVAIGMTPDGPLIRALEQATHASHVALVSEAIFEATVDASGQVTSLSLVDGDGSWDDVRERALRVVAGKIAGHRGHEATFRLRVVSRILAPPAGVLAKAEAVLFLELEALRQTQQRVVHVRRER